MWSVPRLWPGETCFILGGGPSLQQLDIELLRGRRCIAVNGAFRLAPWIDCMFFGDCRWLNQYGGGLSEWAGLKVTTCNQHRQRPGIRVVKRRNSPYGLSRNSHVVGWNLSSGACAINLAVHFGVKRIVLLGFDMRIVGARHNWHDDYAPPPPKKNPYARFLKPFPFIKEGLNELSIECLNATPGSALTLFPMVTLEEVLNDRPSGSEPD